MTSHSLVKSNVHQAVGYTCAIGVGILVLFFSGLAHAATVKSMNKSKNLVIIKDIAPEDGVEEDGSVCIYDEDEKSVGCGKVVKIKKTQAQLKFKSKKAFAKVKVGMSAHAKGEPATADKAAKKGSDEGEEEETPAPYKGTKSPFKILAFYSPALSTPAVFNKLSYNLPTTTAPATIWAPNDPAKTAFLAFNFQLNIPIGSFSLNPGLRYRSYTDTQVDADYSATNKLLYARTQLTATAFGFWTDFQFLRTTFGKSIDFDLTSGIDLDMSTVKFKATAKDDSGATEEKSIATATSSLMVASLRLGAGFDYMFVKSFGIHLGTTVMVPLSELNKKFSGSSEDPNASEMEDPGKDLQTQLGHKKNSVAYEASLGITIAL